MYREAQQHRLNARSTGKAAAWITRLAVAFDRQDLGDIATCRRALLPYGLDVRILDADEAKAHQRPEATTPGGPDRCRD